MFFYTILALGTFIGWAAVRLSLIFLFYPTKLKTIGCCTFQGLIPKLKDESLKKLEGLFSQEFLQEIFKQMEWEKMLMPLVDQRLALFITHLKKQIPMIGMFLNGALEQNLKSQAKEHFLSMIPELQHNVSANILEKDVLEKFLSKIQKDFWNDIQKIVDRYVRWAGYFGAFVGCCFSLVFCLLSLFFS